MTSSVLLERVPINAGLKALTFLFKLKQFFLSLPYPLLLFFHSRIMRGLRLQSTLLRLQSLSMLTLLISSH